MVRFRGIHDGISQLFEVVEGTCSHPIHFTFKFNPPTQIWCLFIQSCTDSFKILPALITLLSGSWLWHRSQIRSVCYWDLCVQSDFQILNMAMWNQNCWNTYDGLMTPWIFTLATPLLSWQCLIMLSRCQPSFYHTCNIFNKRSSPNLLVKPKLYRNKQL